MTYGTLTDLCQELRNWFVRKKHFGSFEIRNGELISSEGMLQNGQYFRIIGSVFNDGVHCHPSDDLVDESFSGSVWAMAVPPSVVALADEIKAWRDKYENIDSQAMSPFNSESFGGYSYSKSGTSTRYGGSASSVMKWQDMFASELNRWRKIL